MEGSWFCDIIQFIFYENNDKKELPDKRYKDKII